MYAHWTTNLCDVYNFSDVRHSNQSMCSQIVDVLCPVKLLYDDDWCTHILTILLIVTVYLTHHVNVAEFDETVIKVRGLAL